MCWSGEVSAVLAVAGVGSAVYAYKKGDSPYLYVPVFYFALMELLQALTYPYINMCGAPQNQFLTFLSYIHIVFQPFFISAIYLYFIPEVQRKKFRGIVFFACFAAAIMLLIRAFPFPWAPPCQIGEILCAQNLCTVSGSWHLAWNIPLNNYFTLIPPYVVVVFILPLIYGSWRAMLFVLLTGPLLVSLTTNNPNEGPAVWCLFSVVLILIMFLSPLRNKLYVRSWPLWTRSKEKGADKR